MVFCDKPDKAKLLLTGVEKGETPILNTIVIMESFGTDLVERGKKCGVEVFSMREIEVSMLNLLYCFCPINLWRKKTVSLEKIFRAMNKMWWISLKTNSWIEAYIQDIFE